MWLPGTAAAMPAIIAARVVSISAAHALGGDSPTKNVRAASPCQPSTMAPASIDDDLAPRMIRSPGMPWTISSSSEMQRLAGKVGAD